MRIRLRFDAIRELYIIEKSSSSFIIPGSATTESHVWEYINCYGYEEDAKKSYEYFKKVLKQGDRVIMEDEI